MSTIGHNGGPGLGGTGWTRYCWSRARADLFPKLPLEVVRLRVKRAAEIGLDYKTYAGIRATTGHDLAAFLYSSNVLHMLREAEAARIARLAATRDMSHRLAVQGRHAPADLVADLAARGLAIARAEPAPDLRASASQTRGMLRDLCGRIPADRVLLIAETGLEAEWASLARLAAAIPAERYFAAGVTA